MLDLSKKPYCLTPSRIARVQEVLSSMTLEEKMQQVFFCLTASRDESYLSGIAKRQKPGGIRYNPASVQDVAKHNSVLQSQLPIRALIAANCESGGSGAFRGGTEIGCGTKIGSTGDPKLAYEMGRIGALEAKQAGVNTLFAPIVDIHHDFHNPIIAYKCFGSDPEKVALYSKEFLRGVQDEGLIACAKHFPGDGYDERDQHLSPSVNPLSVEEWDASFGLVYQTLIDEGLPMVMAGHIQLPAYERFYNPSKNVSMPGSLSKELITDLLRGKLGFEGVVVTDATHMVAYSCAGKREDLIPLTIASGVDMILFYNDYEEDLGYLRKGVEHGVVTEERLNEAVTRILGLKAKLGLLDPDYAFPPLDPSAIGSPEANASAKIASEKGIVLVKEEEGVLPLSPSKTKRILLVPQEDENPFASMMPKGMPTNCGLLKARLEKEGFDVEIFESLMDKAKKASPMEAMAMIGNVYNAKTPIEDFKKRGDLVIHVCDFDSHNTVTRILWKMSKGTPDIPWYVDEVPTIMVSLKNPFHLFDAPMVKTYINCYDKTPFTLDALVEKLLGRQPFTGISPVDAFCGMDHNQ